MSDQPNKTMEITNEPNDANNVTANLKNIQIQLMDIDKTDGKKAQELMEEIGALRASSYHDKNVKGPSGKTVDELVKAFDALSESIGKKKAALEAQLNAILHPPEYTPEERETILKERTERANAAAQEKPKDLTAFSNPELDRIRAELQKNPLKTDNAAIDDGTGGEGGKPSGPNQADGQQQNKKSG